MVSLTRDYRANQTNQNQPGGEANGTFRYIGGFEEHVKEVQPSILLARRRAAISLLADLLKALLLKVPCSGTHGMVARTHLLHGLCNPLSPSQQVPGILHSGSFAEVGHAGMRKFSLFVHVHVIMYALCPISSSASHPILYNVSRLSSINSLFFLWNDTRFLHQPHPLLFPDGCDPCMIRLFWLKGAVIAAFEVRESQITGVCHPFARTAPGHHVLA